MSTPWLISVSSVAWADYRAARRDMKVTAEHLAAFERAQTEAASGDTLPRNLRLAGNVAQVEVSGLLTKKPDLFAHYFGGGNTTYSAIQSALAHADASPEVRQIVLSVDSPGGQVDGLFETLAAIQAVKKPIAVQANQATSAAYALAAVAGKIRAVSPSATFGSIGVVSSYYVDDSVVDVTSTEAPNKRPDMTTEEGKAVVRAYLDELHALFVDAIGKGRGIDPKTVNSEFGGGSLFTAGEAKRRGMIDSINGQLKLVGTKATVESGGAEQEKTMDLKTLKAQHPDLVEALLAEGTKQERERGEAHLTMGEQCGDLKLAVEAIKSGVEFGHAPTQAKYLSAAMNRRDIAAAASDDAAAAAATNGAAASAAAARDIGDTVADMLGAPTLETK